MSSQLPTDLQEFFTVTQEYLDNLSCRMDCIAPQHGLSWWTIFCSDNGKTSLQVVYSASVNERMN